MRPAELAREREADLVRRNADADLPRFDWSIFGTSRVASRMKQYGPGKKAPEDSVVVLLDDRVARDVARGRGR